MINTGNSYLIEESLGRQWYFTLNSRQLIEYSRRIEKSWTEPAQVDGQAVKLYTITIDMNDNIYVLAYNTSKQLICYEWKENQWYQRLLHSVSSRFENISYVEVLSTQANIHIFYYIENSLKRAQESLIHAYLKDGKWSSDVLMSFLTDQIVTPQIIRSDESGNLFCIYTRTIRDQTRCYYIFFDNKLNIWSKPGVLFQKPGECSEFNGQMDSIGYFHLVWIEKSACNYRINYKKINPIIKNNAAVSVCIQDGTAQIETPCLRIGDQLHCFWIQDGNGMVSKGDASGQHWGVPKVITENPIAKYYKINKTLDSRTQTLPSLGDGYPSFNWTLETILFNNRCDLPVQKQNEQKYTAIKGHDKASKYEVSQSSNKFNQQIANFQSQLNEFEKKLDNFHTALYQIQDYIQQKDKSSFQTEAQIRKLSFELEQLRSMKAKKNFHRNISTVNDDHSRSLSLFTAQESIPSQQTNKETDNGIPIQQPQTVKENEPPVQEEKKLKEQGIPILPPLENAEITEKQITIEDDLGGHDIQANKKSLNNIDMGSGEIKLGNVNIRINPESDL